MAKWKPEPKKDIDFASIEGANFLADQAMERARWLFEKDGALLIIPVTMLARRNPQTRLSFPRPSIIELISICSRHRRATRTLSQQPSNGGSRSPRPTGTP